MAGEPHFRAELFQFLEDLRRNNNREWFLANKGRYESHVRDPMLRFISDFGPHLHNISSHYVADPRPVGGSLFRIYRDTRFSKDKSPYKTHAAAHFRHEVGKDVHGPGFYLHMEPGNVYAGVGIWHPDSQTLGSIRNAIVAHPDRWKRAINDKAFKSAWALEGDSLQRPPKGYDPDHPLIEDLKRKDFIATTRFPQEDACAPDFIDRFAKACQAASLFMRFLTEAVRLVW